MKIYDAIWNVHGKSKIPLEEHVSYDIFIKSRGRILVPWKIKLLMGPNINPWERNISL
jgi:hypothetical protein